MRTTFSLSLIIIAFLFSSCDYLIYQSGIVVDNTSYKPLDSAIVVFQQDTLITDSTGLYEFIHRYKDRNQTIEVYRNGYKPMYLELDISGQNFSYSVLRGSEYIKLNPPRMVNNDPNIILYNEIHWTTSIGFEVLKTDSLKIKLDKK